MKMKKCKACNGKGFTFHKDDSIDTGKVIRYFGYEMPVFASGTTQATCGKCFGKGVR